MNKTQKLYQQAKKIIHGGTQLLSKRPEMFLPGIWPAYYTKAKGCEVWDLDGVKFIDMCSMGIGSCVLGYADADVDATVKRAIDKGAMSTLNAPEEVELAQLLCKIHPWAEMVRFARCGGEAMAIAVRIARAKSQKDLILFCGYNGWHDWYLSANLASKKSLDGHHLPGLEPRGVPRKLIGTSIPFNYNDTAGFLKLINKHKNKIAAVVMEPIRNYYPQKGFLETIRRTTEKLNIALVFDEVSSAWKSNLGGAHLRFKVYPDICVFAKGMSNGYPMAAIIGRKQVMLAAQETFISSTYWTDRIGPTAALATIRKLKDKNVAQHLIKIGRQVVEGWQKIATKHSLGITRTGTYPLAHFSFNHEKHLVLRSILTQEMLKKGFLASTDFKASYAQKEKHIKGYLGSLNETFAFIAKAINSGRPEKYLRGQVCHSGFKRLA